MPHGEEADMGELKSAFERAMERAERLGKASEEEVRRGDLLPQGESLAARYVRGECSLAVELSRYDEQARSYVEQGAMEVLLRSIDPPANDHVRGVNRRAMEGVKSLKQDKGGVENVYTKMRRLFKHYESEGAERRSQAYEALKKDFVDQAQQLARQRGLPVANMDVERQPQFQQQWRRVSSQLDAEYRRLLEEYRRELEELP
jgi:hypothetical protein